MTISATDIKLRQSQRLTDNPDGGGRMVATEIVDGAMNNLFPDIGDEERTTGRSTLRKMFVHVDTAGTDVLKDAIGVIVDPPDDSRVSMSMFATGSYSDVRADARDVVERFVSKGVESRMVLMGNHFPGQQAMSVYCHPDASTPDVNDNLCLSTDAQGYAPAEQYVRVKGLLSRTTQTFYDDQGSYTWDVMIIELVTPLLYNFYGQDPARFTSTKPPTRVYQTNNVDAASYYSVKSLQVAAAVGDLSVKVASPYVHIVPATTAETPVVDQLAGLGTMSFVQAGPAESLALSYSGSFLPGVPLVRFLGSPLVKGSVRVTAGSLSLVDDGNGGLAAVGVSPWNGTIDYAGGSIALSHASGANEVISIVATPAGALVDQGYTSRTDIVLGNQGYNYIFQLSPLPSPGTVSIDYRALGRWIRLSDNGTGQLAGGEGQGSGTINYATGAVVVTLGALPDLESAILCTWGTGVIATRRDGASNLAPPALDFLLAHTGIKPGELSLTIRVGGNAEVATDDGAGRLILGGVQRGSIVYSTGQVALRPPVLPDANSMVLAAYRYGELQTATYTPVPGTNAVVSVQLSGPVAAGSVRLEWLTTMQPYDPVIGSPVLSARLVAADDGQGNLVLIAVGGRAVSQMIGTVDYANGSASFQAGQITVDNVASPIYQLDQNAEWRFYTTAFMPVITQYSAGTLISAYWQAAGASSSQAQEEIALPPVSLDLTPALLDSIVPGSVRFTFRGRTYVDRSGSVYMDIDPVTGAGTFAGTLDYESGQLRLVNWAASAGDSLAIAALLTRSYDPGTSTVDFRTPGAPLRAGSFTLRATTLAGVQITGQADINGALSGDLLRGEVDWETGVVRVRFGQYVPAAGNEGEPWYSAANVVGDTVWRPLLVVASSIYFGTVVFRSIPLSSVVIGLDSIRLPSDGRVPAFKPGQTVLVHHTVKHSIASPTPGQVVNFGRTRIAQSEVRDSAGTPIESAWYTQDLDDGTLTFSDPLNLAAYQLPVVISERVEDRRLLAGVQITGELQLNSGLTHAYPPGETLVSTALRLGEANGSLDLQARVESVFDQATWANTWRDQREGDAAPATYNDTDYPLVVTNADAITERWAVRFTSQTQFEVMGETVGTITTGSTTADCAPINPRTGEPYFVIKREGWGTGWSVNNALRFNTIGALAPVWMVRTTLPGTPENAVDSFRFQVIGNIAGDAE